jgi:hypothetical protein
MMFVYQYHTFGLRDDISVNPNDSGGQQLEEDMPDDEAMGEIPEQYKRLEQTKEPPQGNRGAKGSVQSRNVILFFSFFAAPWLINFGQGKNICQLFLFTKSTFNYTWNFFYQKFTQKTFCDQILVGLSS